MYSDPLLVGRIVYQFQSLIKEMNPTERYIEFRPFLLSSYFNRVLSLSGTEMKDPLSTNNERGLGYLPKSS